jgi:NitT/TauT family transport system permease protein
VSVGLLWEGLSWLGLLDPQFFPPPSETLALAVRLYVHGAFLTHVWVSLRRVLLAVLLGGSAGVAVGVLSGWSAEVRLLVNPSVSLLYPLPKIALLPVLFTVVGVTETARVLTMSLAVFPLVTVTTMGGVRAIDDVHVEAALDNGAGTLGLYREVVLPGALSSIFSGLSLGFGMAFVLLVVIEMAAANAGLGHVVWSAWQVFRIPRLYVALLTLNVLGIGFVHGTDLLGDLLTPWEAER